MDNLILQEMLGSSGESEASFESDSSSEGFLTDQISIILGKTKQQHRNCIKNYFEDVMPLYSEKEFITHFRINRSLFECVAEKYEVSNIFKKIGANKSISAKKQVAVFLWFAGHEACAFRDIADRFDLSLWSVHHIICRLTSFISSMSDNVICWPDENRKKESSECFSAKGFNGKIGALDATHIVIDPPAQRKDSYIDRKGNYSISLQAICNEDRKFIDVFIGYPGSVHDCRVFKNSNVYKNLHIFCGSEYYILGDSAYPCSEHVIVPFRDNGHLNNLEKKFNKRLGSSRVIIEHSFGILKQRFRQLYYCKLRGMEKLCHFVRACCVLHNLANEDDLEDLVFEDPPESNDSNENYEPETVAGRTKRQRIAEQMFTK